MNAVDRVLSRNRRIIYDWKPPETGYFSIRYDLLVAKVSGVMSKVFPEGFGKHQTTRSVNGVDAGPKGMMAVNDRNHQKSRHNYNFLSQTFHIRWPVLFV